VSPITVSRVINNHPLVTAATRARVEEAIAALGYRSNMAARTLAGGRSRVIGVVSVETELYGPSHVLFGIEAAARDADHSVNFVMVKEPSIAELKEAFNRLNDAHAEGVVVLAPVQDAVDALAHIQPSVPFVVTSAPGDALATVSIDQTHGARLATAHLLDLGHETVHHVRGPKGWLEAEARVTGWRKELRARGKKAPSVVLGDWTARSGYEAGLALAADPTVTAVFAANDQMALGLMLAVRGAGRRVPEDISVVGFDNVPESEYFSPPLTTVQQDLREVGHRVIELLVGMMGGASSSSVLLEPTLVVRSSTAPPGGIRPTRRR
jgi:DNA-binding LacI/PurR family transcriptional regulator